VTATRSQGSIDWPPASALGFWNIARNEPKRTALFLQDGSSASFGDLLAAANRLSHAFRTLGLVPGDCVASVLPNDANCYAIELASLQSGLYFCPLNHHLTGPEIAYVVEDSEAKLLIAHDRFAEPAVRAAQEVALASRQCLAIGEIEGFAPLEEIMRRQPDTAPSERRPGSRMAYTSGTTGQPKGVRRPLPEGNPDDLAAESAIFARAFGLRPLDGVHLVVGPLYHAGPHVFSWGSLHVGHAQVLTDRFDAQETLALIERYRVTNTHLVATMFHRLLALPKEVRSRYDVSSLRMVGHTAAPTPVEVKQRMMDWWGPVIWETYGGTEGAATIAKPHHWLKKPGTVGHAVRGVKVRVLDEDGAPCPPGRAGTVYIETSGPRFSYWKDDEKTRSTYRGDSFTLGDLGYLDEEGFLFLTGRKSEVIISGGVNIYPAEVENVLLTHSSVADLAVLGVPDEEWGERVVAVVEPRAGIAQAGLAEELIQFCRDQIAHYKCPREVHLRAELPRAENGKLYRKRLRDEFWQETGRSI